MTTITVSCFITICINGNEFKGTQNLLPQDDIQEIVDSLAAQLPAGSSAELTQAVIQAWPSKSLSKTSQLKAKELLKRQGLYAQEFMCGVLSDLTASQAHQYSSSHGLIFPEGNFRVVWSPKTSKLSLQSSICVIGETLDILVYNQHGPTYILTTYGLQPARASHADS